MPDAPLLTRGTGQFVRIAGLKRYFDVSAPWLVRAIESRPYSMRTCGSVARAMKGDANASAAITSECGASKLFSAIRSSASITIPNRP